MKVLLVAQEFPPSVIGGVGLHAYNLAAALVDRGHAVHVLAGSSRAHTADASMKSLPDVSVSRLPYRRTVAPRVWFARKAVRWLQSFEALPSFDLLHAHEYLDFDRVPFDGPTLQKIHFNLTEKPAYLSSAAPPPFNSLAKTVADKTIWRAERRLERRAIVSATGAIANSRLTRRLCRDRHDLEEQAIEVIYNGVDAARFSPTPGVTEAGRLLYLGGSAERKGWSALRAAAGHLDAEAGITVAIAGDLAEADVGALGEQCEMDHLGHVPHDDLPREYRRASAVVHPARYEPFGNVVLESLACGTPVIVSNSCHCGAAELVGDRTGVRLDPTDSNALAAAMESLSSRPEQYPSTACRELAEEYPWERVARRTIAMAEDLS